MHRISRSPAFIQQFEDVTTPTWRHNQTYLARGRAHHELEVVQHDMLHIMHVDGILHGVQHLVDARAAKESQKVHRERREIVGNGLQLVGCA